MSGSSIGADLAETTPHECRLIAGERTGRTYVRHAARPRSMLWPSAAAHGPPELGRSPPALTRGPRALRAVRAPWQPGPNRLLRAPRPHRKVRPPTVLHRELPEQRRRHP